MIGKLLSAGGGKLKVETAFAGTIEIAQDKVKGFTTDEAVNVELAAGSTVLVPLCGKAHDLAFLAERGHRVVGVELSEIAVRAVFSEHEFEVSQRASPPFTCDNLLRADVTAGVELRGFEPLTL